MFQAYYQGNEWLALPVVALVFFFVFFLAVVLRVPFRMRDPSRTGEMAMMPLADEKATKARKEADHG